nr:hypothetical protein [Verrucomicrobium spinosum]
MATIFTTCPSSVVLTQMADRGSGHQFPGSAGSSPVFTTSTGRRLSKAWP